MKVLGNMTAVLAICLCWACSKNPETGEDIGNDSFEQIESITQELNANSLSIVVSDDRNDYYQDFDVDRVTICKRNRTSGEVVVLAERPWVEKQNMDVTFSDFYLKDNYLYFTVFDANNDIRFAWCRVPVDGSSGYETITEFGYDYNGFHYDGENIYMLDNSGAGSFLRVLDIETGTLDGGYAVPGDMTPIFIYDGYVYCSEYTTTDEIFHIQIYRYRTGSTDPELVWSNPQQETLQCIAYNSKLYMVDPYNKKFFETDPDGKNDRVLLEDVGITRMNFHNGSFYFLVNSGSSYKNGIYRYVPGTDILFPVYLSDDIVYGPIITGTEDIWFTLKIEDSNFRFGQLHYVDGKYEIHDI